MDFSNQPAATVTDQSFRTSTPLARVVPNVVAVIGVTLAAIALNPERSPTLIASVESGVYFLVAFLIGMGLFVWDVMATGSGRERMPAHAANALLVTSAPALALVERTVPGVIILLLVLSAGLAVAQHRREATGESVDAWIAAAIAAGLVWFAVAGLSGFRLEGRFGMPLAAAVAAAGALAIARTDGPRTPGLLLVGVIAVAGAELTYALSFLQLQPFATATAWLAGFVAAFGIVAVIGLKVTR